VTETNTSSFDGKDILEFAVLGALFLDEQNRYIENVPEYIFKDKDIRRAFEFLKANMHVRDIASLMGEIKKEKIRGGGEFAKLMIHAMNQVQNTAMLPMHLKQLKDIRRREEVYNIAQGSEGQLTSAEIKKLHDLTEDEIAESLSVKKFSDMCLDMSDVLEERKKRYSGGVPYPTGLPTIDEKTGGVHKKDVLIIGGRTSMGKTSLMTNFAVNVARRGAKVLYMNGEMPEQQIVDRIVSGASWVESYKIRYANLKDEEYKSIADAMMKDSFGSIPLFLCYAPSMTMAHIREAVYQIQPDFVFVDHIQLLRIKNTNKAQGMEDAMYEMKGMAGEKNVGFVVGSQVSRDSIKGRSDATLQPVNYKGSGGIEDAADSCMEIKLNKNTKKDDAIWSLDLEINKQRHGPVGTVPVKFYRKYLTFSEN
jgi:replicative DNA helicase